MKKFNFIKIDLLKFTEQEFKRLGNKTNEIRRQLTEIFCKINQECINTWFYRETKKNI